MSIRIRNGILTALAVAGLGIGASAQAQPYGGPGPGYGDPRYTRGDVVECASHGYSYERCEVPWRDVRMVRQLSDSQCVRGRNWGFDRRGGFIWVDRGCAGRFVAQGGYRDGYVDRSGYVAAAPPPSSDAWRPEPAWNQRFQVTCESQSHDNFFCQVDVGRAGRVYLERQLSQAPCVEGRSWGLNRAGVWVGSGCRATFTIDRRWD